MESAEDRSVHGGAAKPTGTRKGRKRKQHDIQKVKTSSSSKKFLEVMMEDINAGKVNMLEFVLISAIILYLEANRGKSHISEVKKFYDMILLFIQKFDVALPITCRSLTDIEKAIRKVFAVRKSMK